MNQAAVKPIRRWNRLVAGVLALAAIVAGASAAGVAAAPASAPPRPNFLFILVDDQAMNTFTPQLMPKTYRWIVDPGTKFVDGLAAPPLCCPDRAGILTGQYPHNNGVFSNSPGYPDLIDRRNTLPVWLQRAGYRTGFIGKFLNGYERLKGYAPAPGFGTWFGYDHPTRYFNYTMSDNGQPRRYGNASNAYTTDVFTRQALRFVHSRARRPFFLWLAYNAPHRAHVGRGHCPAKDPVVPDSRYLKYDRLALPEPPSFNEADVSDKPQAVASLPLLGPGDIKGIARRYRCTAAAMDIVDADIGRLMRSLHRRGELRNTIVFYLSDNGYLFGEYRIASAKAYPYDPALQVPYAVRVPRAYEVRRPPHTVPDVVAEQDIAPTMLDYAGGVPSCASGGDCRTIDGRSLRPLLGGGGGKWPSGRGILAELDTNFIDFSTLRTDRYMYTEYPDGERELYDLRHDPFELDNRAGDPIYAGVQAVLAARLAALETCSGHAGPDPCE